MIVLGAVAPVVSSPYPLQLPLSTNIVLNENGTALRILSDKYLYSINYIVAENKFENIDIDFSVITGVSNRDSEYSVSMISRNYICEKVDGSIVSPSVELNIDDVIFDTGSTIKFSGFLEKKDEDEFQTNHVMGVVFYNQAQDYMPQHCFGHVAMQVSLII
ncbi:hypothetical protein [Vibrio cionasavignyae]|uniref:hypothetical protein n=1 Tax=Vibrio cionasavignyae TaxID=2910252 RepID=UPI003D0ECE6E